MKKFLLLFLLMLFSIQITQAKNVCVGDNCFEEVYTYPRLGFYAFVIGTASKDKFSDVFRKLSSYYSYDETNGIRYLVFYRQTPDINVFKQAPKNKLGDLEKVSRTQNPYFIHLSVKYPDENYAEHYTMGIINGRALGLNLATTRANEN